MLECWCIMQLPSAAMATCALCTISTKGVAFTNISHSPAIKNVAVLGDSAIDLLKMWPCVAAFEDNEASSQPSQLTADEPSTASMSNSGESSSDHTSQQQQLGMTSLLPSAGQLSSASGS